MSRIVTEAELREAIASGGPLDGESSLGSCAISVQQAVPYVATAIHAGERLRGELAEALAVDRGLVAAEEDRGTAQFIADFPITLSALDSRFEYDLNRAPARALPLAAEDTWGLDLYRGGMSAAQQARSLAKHDEVYGLVDALVEGLLGRFGRCVVFDVHSYNLQRQRELGFDPPPVFNVGSSRLDVGRWRPELDAWLEALGGIEVPGVPVTVTENAVFQGKGYLCAHLTERYDDVLVLPTEVSKVYLDQATGEPIGERMAAIRAGLWRAAAQLISR